MTITTQAEFEKKIEQEFAKEGAKDVTVMLFGDSLSLISLDKLSFDIAKDVMSHTSYLLVDEFRDNDGFSATYVLPEVQ